MQGQPQRIHSTNTSVVPNKPRWHQTDASPLGLPAQVCFHCLQTRGWPGDPGKRDGGTRDGAMLQPGTRVLSGCPCWLPGKARLGRMAPKWGDSPLTQPLGTPLACPEMGRSWMSLQVHNQPGQNFAATRGLLPITDGQQGEEPTPKPAWPWAVGAHRGAAPALCSQPARTKLVTKAGIKAPK